MKNILSLSIVTLAVSSFAVAGGDIIPIEKPVVVEADAGFYLGLAYGTLSHERERNTFSEHGIPSAIIDEKYNEIMIQAGYKFNPYICIEGRYWFGLDDNLEGGIAEYFKAKVDVSVDAWAIYLKPMYPIADALDVYALLGYSSTEYDVTTVHEGIRGSLDMTFDGFSWGLGVSYTFNDNMSIFVDYTSMYDDTTDYITPNRHALNFDDTLYIVNIGLTYKF